MLSFWTPYLYTSRIVVLDSEFQHWNPDSTRINGVITLDKYSQEGRSLYLINWVVQVQSSNTWWLFDNLKSMCMDTKEDAPGRN